MNVLASFARGVDAINECIGRYVAWIALLMVVIQFVVVVMRYVFGVGSIMMQESIVYMHGLLFMLGAGYTLLHNGHVRVDIFYRPASEAFKAWVDLIGVVVLLIPVCIVILLYSLPYVQISWNVYEGSKETSGIQGVFLLKSAIPAFAALVMLQGASLAVHSLLTIAGRERMRHEDAPEGL